MSIITLLVIILVFALLFAIVTWLVPAPMPRNIFYAILAIVAVLVVLQGFGLLGGPTLVRLR